MAFFRFKVFGIHSSKRLLKHRKNEQKTSKNIENIETSKKVTERKERKTDQYLDSEMIDLIFFSLG